MYNLHAVKQHGVLRETEKLVIFSRRLKAKVFRYIMWLKAHQCTYLIINLLRKRPVLVPHYGGETTGIDNGTKKLRDCDSTHFMFNCSVCTV